MTKPALAARWYEKYLHGKTIKTAITKCSGHEEMVSGRKRRRTHIDEITLKFTDGSEWNLMAELPTWGFVGPKPKKGAAR